MTNYNERLDDLTSFMESIGWEFDENGYTFDDNYINFRTANILRQAITSLIKELVAEARINELKHLVNDDGIWHQDMTRKFPQKIRLEERIKELEKFEQNLLKALEEV